MAHRQEEGPEHPTRPRAPRAVLAVTLLFVLAAVSVSAGLVVYTAWLHNLKNGLFALAFAVLSTRAALSWILWHRSYQPTSLAAGQQDPISRKPTDEAMH